VLLQEVEGGKEAERSGVEKRTTTAVEKTQSHRRRRRHNARRGSEIHQEDNRRRVQLGRLLDSRWLRRRVSRSKAELRIKIFPTSDVTSNGIHYCSTHTCQYEKRRYARNKNCLASHEASNAIDHAVRLSKAK
jgi:hypothetical protein